MMMKMMMIFGFFFGRKWFLWKIIDSLRVDEIIEFKKGGRAVTKKEGFITPEMSKGKI